MLSAMTSLKNSVSGSDPAGIHAPVLVSEVIDALCPSPGDVLLDATVGMGGHSSLLLKHEPGIKKLLAMDWDEQALAMAKKRLRGHGKRVRFYQGNFLDMDAILHEEGEPGFNGILMDLGVSSFQLDQSGRGFSFLRDEPLDMRMDRSGTITAADMLNKLPVERLEELIRLYGEERWAGKISKAILARRSKRPILSTKELADIIASSIPKRFHPKKIHPATRTFQALRIAVNRELENLTGALEKASECLLPGGRLVVISFHSLEDRIVKHYIKRDTSLKVLTKRPVVPGPGETVFNPRARSAKLRAAVKSEP